MICNKCYKEKNSEDFSFKNKVTKTRNKICKECHSLYRRQHYLQNKDKYIAKALKWNKNQKEILSKYLFDILSKSKCIDCGEKDIVVLEFDHLYDKKFGITEMFQNSYSIQAVAEELMKCVVRCANCHKRKTAKETKFWNFKMSEINN